ncbi:MAG: polysaccharide deacetylase family protein [Chloroflexota bacterium]|nr:polysaccharide deacetylase family protein [Chloroflexota bacterium]
MNEPNIPSVRNTSLPLIILTLVVGVALGWLLRDRISSPVALVPTPRPTEVPTLVLVAAAAPTGVPPTSAPTMPPTVPVPTSTSTALPTLIPSQTPVSEPTSVPEPSPMPEPTPAPPAAAPADYAGHVVEQGETLAMIAARGGSTPELIAQYNRLEGEPQPGHMLLVPRVAGADSTLESAPLLVQRGPTDKPWVALTLDAGADAAPVPAMLKTLREHNVNITFFLTGKWIKDNPELAREIVADGHEIANHTFTHPDMRNLSDAAILQELADTEALLAETTGTSSRPLFRPPFGAYDKRVLQLVIGAGYLPIYWTLDSLDSVGDPKTPDFLFERVTAKLTPEQLRGAIILAHCGSQPTADALPRILDRFAEMGFEVKKVSEILG